MRVTRPVRPILTPDGMVHHPAPVCWFPRLTHWFGLLRLGPGARSITASKLAARRVGLRVCEYCEDLSGDAICAQCRDDLGIPVSIVA